MSSRADRSQDSEQVGEAALWWGALAGPIAWSLHLLVSYALVQPACSRGLEVVLWVVSAVTLCLAAVGGVVAWRSWSTIGGGNDFSLRAVSGRRAFMAAFGVIACVLFAAGIILASVPLLFLGACE